MKPAIAINKPERTLLQQFIMFTGVGAIGTAAQYLVLILLVQIADITPVYASSCGLIVGAVINYILNYYYTFESNKQHTETLLKFMLVAGLGFILNGIIMYTGTELIDLNYILVQLAATGVVLISNFTFNRLWTFAHNE